MKWVIIKCRIKRNVAVIYLIKRFTIFANQEIKSAFIKLDFYF